MATLFGMFPFLKTLFADSGYQGPKFAKRLERFCRISTLKSSNVPIESADLWCCPNAGSSSAPLRGSIAAEGLPRIGRISTEKLWRSCASPQSASCSENYAIQPEVSGRTLTLSGLDNLDSYPRSQQPALGREGCPGAYGLQPAAKLGKRATGRYVNA